MILVNALGNIMYFCYQLCQNYGIAIILFTLISKVVLLPLSVWVQKNSIKMVKIQPDVNKIKINYFGDKDKIAEEEAKLYKKEKYNAFASLIPLVIQIVLLMGLVAVINHPLTYILKTSENTTTEMINVALEHNEKLSKESSSLEIEVVKEIHNNRNIEEYEKVNDSENTLTNIKNFNTSFLGFDLGWVATVELGLSLWVPILAGFSALLLCIAQNKMNVLQKEQSNMNQYGMLILSVGLSLYLGAFVASGVALYWIVSNLFAIVLQWLLNIVINPKKYVNYEELEKSNKELQELNAIKKKYKLSVNEKKKTKEDYKKFFKIVNKHLVFYSESNGFYKYYKGIIEYLLKYTNITIHYITSDYNDTIFELEKKNPQIKAYFIDEKRLITLMMKIDADVVAMTMPDLENFHIKKSYIRKDIHYVYIPHGVGSNNLTLRDKAIDHYDSIFAATKSSYDECIEANKIYNLENRKIIKWGYSLLDDMIKDYQKTKQKNKVKQILIAPSWQKDNIIDSCLEEILNHVKGKEYQIIVRPHPQHVRHAKEKFEQLKEKYKEEKNITIQTDFSKNDTIFNSDILITDWSDISYEFAFTTKKPVIFIDTPMKVMNPNYKDLTIEPFNIWARYEIGKVISLDKLDTMDAVINDMLKNGTDYQKKITKLTEKEIYNLGNSAEVGAKYIIKIIEEKIKERKSRK